MYDNPATMESQFLRPLVEVWRERINAAKRHKAAFDNTRKQCMDFFEASAGFMWGEKHKNAYFNGRLPVPKFQITVALAYEFVAIYGPHLFWSYANCKANSNRQTVIEPWLFGDVENDPAAAEAFQMAQQQEQLDAMQSDYVNRLIETVLNWALREQPGGVVRNGRMATTEALLSGCGLLAAETYSFPGSEHKYPRARWVPIDSLYIDADCRDPLWEDCGFLILEHCDPVWRVERMFGLAPHSLEKHANKKSEELVARQQAGQDGSVSSKTQDMIVWYEVWSRCGVGPRTSALSHDMLDAFDDTLGDYAYLCLAEGVNFPLNAPPESFFEGEAEDGTATPEEIAARFEWRTVGYGEPMPFWKDNRWPVEPLIFDRLTNSPWPLPPLAPGLGELIAINILTSAYVDITWENRKRIIAGLKSAKAEIESALKSDDAFCFVEINENVSNRIDEMVQFLDRQVSQTDILTAIAKLQSDFERRVGLTDIMRGAEGQTQVRVAADIQIRSQNAQARPEKMANDVSEWMSAVCQSAMLAAVVHCGPEGLLPLLGPFGAKQWQDKVQSIDLETLMRETKIHVEASEIRRPNHDRDTANAQAMQQYMLPLLQAYAQSTGNTAPLNGFMEVLGDAIEMDTAPFRLDGWSPPVDPAAQETQQRAAEAEVAETEASAKQKQAAADKAQADAIAKLAELGRSQSGFGPQEQKLIHNEQLHTQKLIHNEADHQQSLEFAEEMNEATETKNEKTEAD